MVICGITIKFLVIKINGKSTKKIEILYQKRYQRSSIISIFETVDIAEPPI
jgi:hypothetical protein